MRIKLQLNINLSLACLALCLDITGLLNYFPLLAVVTLYFVYHCQNYLETQYGTQRYLTIR